MTDCDVAGQPPPPGQAALAHGPCPPKQRFRGWGGWTPRAAPCRGPPLAQRARRAVGALGEVFLPALCDRDRDRDRGGRCSTPTGTVSRASPKPWALRLGLGLGHGWRSLSLLRVATDPAPSSPSPVTGTPSSSSAAPAMLAGAPGAAPAALGWSVGPGGGFVSRACCARAHWQRARAPRFSSGPRGRGLSTGRAAPTLAVSPRQRAHSLGCRFRLRSVEAFGGPASRSAASAVTSASRRGPRHWPWPQRSWRESPRGGSRSPAEDALERARRARCGDSVGTGGRRPASCLGACLRRMHTQG